MSACGCIDTRTTVTTSIVDNHRGTISLSSSRGQGTTVSLTLPDTVASLAAARQAVPWRGGCAGDVVNPGPRPAGTAGGVAGGSTGGRDGRGHQRRPPPPAPQPEEDEHRQAQPGESHTEDQDQGRDRIHDQA